MKNKKIYLLYINTLCSIAGHDQSKPNKSKTQTEEVAIFFDDSGVNSLSCLEVEIFNCLQYILYISIDEY